MLRGGIRPVKASFGNWRRALETVWQDLETGLQDLETGLQDLETGISPRIWKLVRRALETGGLGYFMGFMCVCPVSKSWGPVSKSWRPSFQILAPSFQILESSFQILESSFQILEVQFPNPRGLQFPKLASTGIPPPIHAKYNG